MILSNYIKDLLYRYNCVTIPEFGGFVANLKSAQINPKANTFSPPFKQISFNVHLQNNDGLLVNYISEVDECSYDDALKKLNITVLEWKESLQKNKILDLKGIGYLSLNQDKNIVFEPTFIVNYLTSSFGLSSFVSPEIEREIAKEQISANSKKVIPITYKNSKSSNVLKYAAIFVVGISVMALSSTAYNKYQKNEQVLVAQHQQKHIEKKIQQATFEILKPLPSITIHAKKEIRKYNIVIGAFRNNLNATNKVKSLKNKGFNASIVGKNKWDLTMVAIGSFTERAEALQELHKIRRTINRYAWLFVVK